MLEEEKDGSGKGGGVVFFEWERSGAGGGVAFLEFERSD